MRVAAAQAIEDRSARRIGYRKKNVGGCCWSRHCEKEIGNVSVTYFIRSMFIRQGPRYNRL